MEDGTNNGFGGYVKQLRQERQLSIRELAARIGLDSGALTRIEHGKVATPRPGTLRGLATALDVPPADMFARAGYVTPEELPDLATYLRLRYGNFLSEDMCILAERYLQQMLEKMTQAGEVAPRVNGSRGVKATVNE
ncbi:helix-turn-helix domain-containing protein [Streptomyces sp. NPDC019531]|uniref:helix-turn-helix domain-containing protein n=1 Tax=Streptomyces sp. NPDC019531 TaxID=3365062 RepID=UPI00384D245F